MVKDKKYYDILGVSPDATQQQIKKAYHKLAQRYHSDKNPEDGDRLKPISCVYNVLKDRQKREIYDLHGVDGFQEGAGGSGMQSPSGGARAAESWSPWLWIVGGFGILGLALYFVYGYYRRDSPQKMIKYKKTNTVN